MHTSTVSIQSTDGQQFSAYLAKPEAQSAPSLVLLQYICGVNRVMRELAQAFAAQGYLVVVPDLFWRQAPDVELINDPTHPDPAEQQRALQLNDGFDDELGMLDLKATLAYVRARPEYNRRVGALGYCLGGRLAYLMATRTDVDCAVSYYGVNIERYLGEAERVACPLLMHMAGRDYLVPEATRQTILNRLGAIPGVQIIVHPDVNHAFALMGGANYSAAAAQRANDSSDAFLGEHLKAAAPRR